MKPIFILNAPPRTGKDTIANRVIEECGIRTASFKYPMYDIFIRTTGMPAEEFFTLYETSGWKDTPAAFLNGKTPRELMIHISENYIKPFFGKDYYGKWVADYIKHFEQDASSEMVWIIPDGGFQSEFDAMKEVFGDRLVIISLEREGHTDFSGDSRGWVYDWNKYPEKGSVHFDTTNGNEEVVNFIKKEVINAK